MGRTVREKVFAWIEQKKLIQKDDMVFVGVSGGADSVCLLLLLQEYRKRVPFSVQAVHVEHGIRGEESREDAEFTRKLCERLGVSCHICEVDVPGYAREHRMGLEEAARSLRYDCFRRVAGESSAAVKKLALAHHADDNAETVLFQLARGSGVRGLGGICMMRELTGGVTVVRPLLGVTRAQIEGYLREQGANWRTDATNEDTGYSRNRIRHNVLPELLKVNGRAVEHIAQSAAQLSELSDYVEQEAAGIAQRMCLWDAGGCVVFKELFEWYPAVLSGEVVYQAVSGVAGSSRDIGSVHIQAVERLAGLQVGRCVTLPYGILAERVYEGVRLMREAQGSGQQSGGKRCRGDDPAQEGFEISLEELEEKEGEWKTFLLPDGCLRLRVRTFDGETEKIPKKTYTKLLNYDKIKHSMQFRKRAGGDYLTIDGDGHRKKLKEYLIEEKVPRGQRDDIWLLAEESHVLWAVGKRISAGCRVDPDTKKILEVQISGGNYRED